jgi:hypothetical protein
MALSFPSSPQPGDIFTADGRAWTWTGTVWRVQRLIAITDVTGLSADLATRATTAALDAEALARLAAIDSVNLAISTEATNRDAAISDEREAREAAISSLSADLSEETTRALAAEEALDVKIDEEIIARSTLAGEVSLKADLVNGLVPATQLPPISYQTTRYDGDGTTFSFAPPGTLTASDSPSAISVTVNGVTQEPGSDYTLNISTNRVVLTSALPLGDKIVITRPILLPSASTLTAEQLGALTATSTIDGGTF